MNRLTLITAAALALIIGGIMVALLLEASAGPSFRAEDYDSYQECVRNIPAEWGPGSIQREGATDACMYVHQRGRR
jgi:hypothetical protein